MVREWLDFGTNAMTVWSICLRRDLEVRNPSISPAKSFSTIPYDFLKKQDVYPSGPRDLSSPILKSASLISSLDMSRMRELTCSEVTVKAFPQNIQLNGLNGAVHA